MKKIIKLTESDLSRLIRRVISEQTPAATKQVTVSVDCTKKSVDGFIGTAEGFFTKHCTDVKKTTTATEKLLPSGPGQMAFDNSNAQSLIDLGINKSNITWDVGNGYNISINNILWSCTEGNVIAGLTYNKDFQDRWTKDAVTSKININSVVSILKKQCQSFRNQRLSGKA